MTLADFKYHAKKDIESYLGFSWGNWAEAGKAGDMANALWDKMNRIGGQYMRDNKLSYNDVPNIDMATELTKEQVNELRTDLYVIFDETRKPKKKQKSSIRR